MTTPIFPTTWYWVVSDTNPTTQAWESSSGSFVSNSAANYQSWVANGGRRFNGPAQVNVLGAANNGSGAIRLTVDRLQDMVTNDVWVVQNVGGTTEANGTWTITVVSSSAPFTVDLQGSTFVHTYTSGGVADRGTLIDTAAHLYSSINSFNLTLPIPKYTSITLSGSPTAISLPLALVTDVVPNTSDGAVLNLPQANLFGSPPLGQPFTFVGQGSGSTIHNWVLKDFGGNLIGTFGSNEGVIVWNTSNASSAGTWEGFRTRNVTPPAGDAQILTSGSSWQQTLVWLASTPSGDVSMADGGVFTIKNVSAGLLRGYLAGLTLSNDGVSPNTVIDIAAGVCCSDDTTTMMLLGAFTKTTGAWAVGSGNGGLDTGSVANTTWYHVFVIERTDTGVVDALISTSATAPTMPANYTKKRRIGSFLTDGSAHIVAFVQDGDVFRWAAPVDDSSGGFANPGTAAVTRTLTVPTGIQVFADLTVQAVNTGGTASPSSIYLSDLALPDNVAGFPNATIAVRVQTLGAPTILVIGLPCSIRTNTSAQIRSRLAISDAGTTLFIGTLGWTDRRGAR